MLDLITLAYSVSTDLGIGLFLSFKLEDVVNVHHDSVHSAVIK